MKRKLSPILLAIFIFCVSNSNAQSKEVWTLNEKNTEKIITDKAVSRESYPKVFKLYNLDFSALRTNLFSAINNASKSSTTISLPNADGQIELFEVYEASNFDTELQAKFPEIRAFSGKGITDKSASLKLSISPQGIQTMVVRAGNEGEFIEPYSIDHTVYSVFRSQRSNDGKGFTCSTVEKDLTSNLSSQLNFTNRSSAGQLKTMRLAISCTGEFSNYFGANPSNQSTTGPGLVLAALNATLARCNGVFEKDLGLHLNLIAATTNVIFYNPATDPYTTTNTGAGWNTQLQNTLSTSLTGSNTTAAQNNAVYDIGQLFLPTGSNGNAGCIGCVCDTTAGAHKGSAFTAGNGVPQGDVFDIDYVAHEMGHQLGAHHTFSFDIHNDFSSKEVGSGVTIMGYAGITPYDVARNSIPFFHSASIFQIQTNLATKTCPVTVSVTSNNATPTANAGRDFIIPIEAPFKLTGSATDTNGTSTLTYSWEQNDQATSSVTGDSSNATTDKSEGPTFISTTPTSTPSRYFPRLETIMNNQLTTRSVTGDPGWNLESLSSVARTLNFRLTVRDNAVYRSTAPVSVGQTAFDDMKVTVRNTSYKFKVTSQSTNGIVYQGRSTQTVTWEHRGVRIPPFTVTKVKISLSTNNGVDEFPYVLIAQTDNDGTEEVTIPDGINSTNCRIKVEPIGNIFFNVNTKAFTVNASLSNNDFEFQDFSLYPNPNKGSFNLKFTPASNDNIEIKIHDIRGREIYKNTFDHSGTFNKNINLNAVESGIYVISINNSNFKTVKRVIIE